MNDKTEEQVQEIYNKASQLHQKMTDSKTHDPSMADRAFHGYCWNDVYMQNFQREHISLIQKNIDSIQSKLDESISKQDYLKKSLSEDKQSLENMDALYVDAIASGDSEKQEETEKTMQGLTDNSALIIRQINAYTKANRLLSAELNIWGKLKRGVTRSLERQDAEKQAPKLKEAYETFIKVYKDIVPDLNKHCPDKFKELEIPYISLESYSSHSKIY